MLGRGPANCVYGKSESRGLLCDLRSGNDAGCVSALCDPRTSSFFVDEHRLMIFHMIFLDVLKIFSLLALRVASVVFQHVGLRIWRLRVPLICVTLIPEDGATLRICAPLWSHAFLAGPASCCHSRQRISYKSLLLTHVSLHKTPNMFMHAGVRCVACASSQSRSSPYIYTLGSFLLHP